MLLQGVILLSQWMIQRGSNTNTSTASPQPFSIDEIDVCGRVFPQPLATDRLIMDKQFFLANIIAENVRFVTSDRFLISQSFLDRMTYVRACKCRTPTSAQSHSITQSKMSQKEAY